MRRLTKIISTILLISILFTFLPKGRTVSALTRDEYVGQFVERMYTMVLGRNSEAAGFEYWKSRILSGETTGATCAYGFFESAEYRGFNTSNEQYVRTLYNVVLGRECDPAGLQYWLNFLAQGTPRVNILAGFVGSQEYAQICAAYNIAVGSLPTDASTATAVQNAPASTVVPTQNTTSNTGRISRESDGVYFYNDQGIKLTGWQRYEGYRYYFDPDNNGKAVKGWKFIDGLKIFSLLANVADVKSLVIHPASTTHSQLSEEELLDQGIKPNTIRLSIGTENIDDLIEALEEAFAAVK